MELTLQELTEQNLRLTERLKHIREGMEARLYHHRKWRKDEAAKAIVEALQLFEGEPDASAN
ncbi:MAG: hypothetical protein MK081_13345 [Flavobacteriales bacterium]|nr:hypothetical protein [Flavobacteriales bacterium]